MMEDDKDEIENCASAIEELNGESDLEKSVVAEFHETSGDLKDLIVDNDETLMKSIGRLTSVSMSAKQNAPMMRYDYELQKWVGNEDEISLGGFEESSDLEDTKPSFFSAPSVANRLEDSMLSIAEIANDWGKLEPARKRPQDDSGFLESTALLELSSETYAQQSLSMLQGSTDESAIKFFDLTSKNNDIGSDRQKAKLALWQEDDDDEHVDLAIPKESVTEPNPGLIMTKVSDESQERKEEDEAEEVTEALLHKLIREAYDECREVLWKGNESDLSLLKLPSHEPSLSPTEAEYFSDGNNEDFEKSASLLELEASDSSGLLSEDMDYLVDVDKKEEDNSTPKQLYPSEEKITSEVVIPLTNSGSKKEGVLSEHLPPISKPAASTYSPSVEMDMMSLLEDEDSYAENSLSKLRQEEALPLKETHWVSVVLKSVLSKLLLSRLLFTCVCAVC